MAGILRHFRQSIGNGKEDLMTEGQKHFGVTDVEYNIVTTLSNLLQAEDVLELYASDAEEAGDREVADLFREIGTANNGFARRLRDRLRHVLNED